MVDPNHGATIGSTDWWLTRLIQNLMDRQPRYRSLNDYAVGDHPLPNGDTRYVKALKEMQQKSRTNYVALVLNAVTQRMKVRTFKVNGKPDDEAMTYWRGNNMHFKSVIAINDAAKLSDTYAMVLPPDNPGELPYISVEDPRWCIVHPDPLNPFRGIAGLKLYEDYLEDSIVAVLFIAGRPTTAHIYHGPSPHAAIDFDEVIRKFKKGGPEMAGFMFQRSYDLPLDDEIPLIYAQWEPQSGLAECEGGPLDVQDRINHTVLDRMIISKNQAYRQRLFTGITIPRKKDGSKGPPWDPGSDAIWVTEDKDVSVHDLDQADISQILDAVRDDVGDLAALTQTPIHYLTNRVENVSGDALQILQSSHTAKVRERMSSMGWFFEQILKLCYRYMGSEKADRIDASVQWEDPEVRTLAELGTLVANFASGGVPLNLVLERAGFSPDEISQAMEEVRRQQEREERLATNNNNNSNGSANSSNN